LVGGYSGCKVDLINLFSYVECRGGKTLDNLA